MMLDHILSNLLVCLPPEGYLDRRLGCLLVWWNISAAQPFSEQHLLPREHRMGVIENSDRFLAEFPDLYS